MHIFSISNLILLGIYVLSGFFLMAGALGTPGNPDKDNKITSRILNAWGINMVIAWNGIPLLALTTLIALLFQYDTLAWGCAWVSLAISSSLIILLIAYYKYSGQ